MLRNEYLLIENIEETRKKILCPSVDKIGELWGVISRSVRSSKFCFGWYAPFVALITKNKTDIANAKAVMQSYLDKLEVMNYCLGIQFHFWCFAFPHAKWCIYFQWLVEMGVYNEDEIKEISAKLINYQFTNFYFGLRTKPEPECVDNQALSLALSNVIVGYIFSNGENKSQIAQCMLKDGMRRLPRMIGGFPKSGYSGEGTPYMDVVIGPSLWLCIEMLQKITGKTNLLYSEFPPSNVKPIDIFGMIGKSWMPGSLLFPWDNYGYQMGIRSALAYVANKTGDSFYFDKLANDAVWSYDVGAGWAYDDLVWTLIHFPSANKNNSYDKNWFVKEVGGVINRNERYAFQMWDVTTPNYPTRSHVNPNAIIFNAFSVPLSADGSKSSDCHRFEFDNTWKTVNYLKMNEDTRYNFGEGCLGGHSCVIVDNFEGMMAITGGEQVNDEKCFMSGDSVVGDVTPIYKQNFSDITCVKRKTTLMDEKFFIVEDFVTANEPHSISSRFFLRPQLSSCKFGAKIKVNQGVSLTIAPAFNNTKIKNEEIIGYPRKPENKSVMLDFIREKKKNNSNLVVAFPSEYIKRVKQIKDFKAQDTTFDLSYQDAMNLTKNSETTLDLILPPYMEKDLPISRKWWFYKNVKLEKNATHLILPIGIIKGQLYLNGENISLDAFSTSSNLLYSFVEIPKKVLLKESVEILFFSEVPIDHYEGGGDGRTGIYGGVYFGSTQEEEEILSVEYLNGTINILTSKKEYNLAYALMEGETI